MLSLLLKHKLIYSTILTYAAIFTISHYSDTISSSIAHKLPGFTNTANVSNGIPSGSPNSNSQLAQIPQVPEPVAQVAQATPVDNDEEPEPPKVIQQTIVRTITEQPTIIVQGITQDYVDSRYADLSAQIKSAVSQIAQQNSNTLLATVGNMAQVFSRPSTNLSNTVVTNGTLSGAFSGTITNSSFSGSSIAAETGDFSANISLASISSPAVTSNKLYNVGGVLYWNGSAVATGLSPWVQGTGLVRPASTNNQVLIGASATTTTAALEINGNLAIRENNGLQIGAYRALTVDDGDSAVLIGRFSSFSPTGNGQVAIGRETINAAADDGYYNVAIGDYAFRDLTGGESVAIGYSAGKTLSSAYSNVAIGAYAMESPFDGDYNVGIGYRTLRGDPSYAFSGNTAVGNESQTVISNGSYNTTLGSFSGNRIDTGSENTYIGESAGRRWSGSRNITLGYRSGYDGSLTQYTGSDNILIGDNIYPAAPSQSGYLSIGNLIFGQGLNGTGSTVSTGSVGIGSSTPFARLSVTGHSASTTPIFTVASSTNTPIFTVTHDGKVGIGTTSPASIFGVTGTTTIAGGINIVTPNSNRQKGYITFNGANLITTDQWNWGLTIGRGDYAGAPENNGHIAIGVGAGKAAGYGGIAIGNLAGNDAQFGDSIAIGSGAIQGSLNSSEDVAIGKDALSRYYTQSNSNVAIGNGALAGNNAYTVTGNAVVGYRAMNQNTDGSYNSVLGYQAMDAGRGDYNVAVGYLAGRSYIAPDDSIFIGKNAGGIAFASYTGTNNIFIGNGVGPIIGTENNFMTIGNLIYGTTVNGTGTTLSTGNIGIGTSSPRYRLHVASTTNNEVARFEGVPGQQCTITAGTGIACTSDERFKTNISEVASTTLSKVLGLKPVTFNWKANPDGSPQVGFIAQDIEKLYPELVATDNEGNKSVFYSQFVALLTKAIQVIEARLTALEKKVDTLLANAGNTVVINQNAGQYITSKTITTEELRVQPANALASGITITDRGTGNLLCAYFEYGALKTVSGACMAPEAPPTPSEPMASTTPTTPPVEPVASTTQELPPPEPEPVASTTPTTPPEQVNP